MYILILLSAFLASADLGFIENHANSRLKLGIGVNPLTEQPHESCIEYEKERFEDGSSELRPDDFTATNLPVIVEHITSYEQMSKYSSSSVGASVSYAFVSASLSQSREEGSNMFSDQASVGLDMSADYGRYFVTNVRLKEEYKKLAQENRKEFYRKCGTEYVAGYRVGQGIRVKMSVSASAVSSYSRISTAVGAAVNYGALGAGLSGAFSNAASSLMAASSMQIEMTTFGTGNLQSISTIVATENDAVKFREKLAEYVRNVRPESAIKTHFITLPYFPEDTEYNPMLVQVQRSTVRSLYSDFMILLGNKERLEETLRNGNLRVYLGVACNKAAEECDTYIQTMEKEAEWVESEMEDLSQRFQKCLNATTIHDCKTKPDVHVRQTRLQRIIWPKHFRYKLLQAQLDDIRDR